MCRQSEMSVQYLPILRKKILSQGTDLSATGKWTFFFSIIIIGMDQSEMSFYAAASILFIVITSSVHPLQFDL